MTIDASFTDPGERLLWSGKPVPWVYALRKGASMFLFGLFFFGFSLFWIYGAWRAAVAVNQAFAPDEFPIPFWLFGIPFVLAGAAMVLSPLWYFFRGAGTTYALTDRRAIIDVAGPLPKRLSVPLTQMPFIEFRPFNRAVGDVLFHDVTKFIQGGHGQGRTTQRDGFVAIPDAAQVEQTLRAAMDKTARLRQAAS